MVVNGVLSLYQLGDPLRRWVGRLMPQEYDDERLIFKLSSEDAVELSSLGEGFGGLAREYQRHLQQSGIDAKGAQAKLFVTRIQTGSVEFELAIVAGAFLSVHAAVSGVVVWADFFERVKSSLEYLANRAPKPSKFDHIDAHNFDSFLGTVTGKRGSNIKVRRAKYHHRTKRRETIAEFEFTEQDVANARYGVATATAFDSPQLEVVSSPSIQRAARKPVRRKRGDQMTVCIGAVCEKGKALVVAADRMVTYGAPISMQVEAAVKIIPIADNALVLFSGAASEGEEVANRTKAKIQGGKHDIKTIADFAQVSYQELKRKRAEDMILRPLLGLDFGGFQHLIGQSASSQVLAQILGMVSQHNLQLDVMVAGIDGDGAHLSLVAHPGTVFPMGTIGSWAIGSGGTHASVRMSLARQTKDVSLPETILNVYEAKRASEVAPGVGKLTDMAVLNGKGVTFLESATFKALSSFEKEKPTLSAEDLTKLRKTCEVYADEPAKK